MGGELIVEDKKSDGQTQKDLKVESLDDLFEDLDIAEEKPKTEEKTAPILPQENTDDYDLQKELEAKFDELFGPSPNK